jgi:Peptidase M1 N-terminal domain
VVSCVAISTHCAANRSLNRAKPSHYAISLHDIDFGGNFGYKGTVTINTKITKDDGFSELVLNAHQLKVHAAELKAGDANKSAKNISYDEKRQRVTLDFGEKINYSGDVTLEVRFEGTINNVRLHMGWHSLRHR